MEETLQEAWAGFEAGPWEHEVDVRDFIQRNYTPYEGDESFLEDATPDTEHLWKQVMDLFAAEQAMGGVIAMDTDIISTITSHGPGYIDQDRKSVV